MAGQGPRLGAMGELPLRIASAIVMAAFALLSVAWGGAVFILFWGLVFAGTFAEWIRIAGAAPSATRPLWWLGGALYAGLPAAAMLAFRMSESAGPVAILFLFAVVWGADIGAYFAGRTFGGPKLAPSISPKKTWSGLIGGILVAILAGSALLWLHGLGPKMGHAWLAGLLAGASAAGDLFESWFKRHFVIKDSGRLIPGHGGLMDRLDGFIVALLLAAAIGFIRAGPQDLAHGLIAGW